MKVLAELRDFFDNNEWPGNFDSSQAAVSIILLKDQSDEVGLVFIKRQERADDPWSGHIAFPGGRYEDSDISLLQTAIRETSEEINLNLVSENLLGSMNPYSPRMKVNINVHPFIFVCYETIRDVNRHEVERVMVVPLRDFFDASRFGQQEFHFKGISAQLPVFKISDSDEVWGVTYVLLLDFLQRIKQTHFARRFLEEHKLDSCNLDQIWKVYPYR